MEKNANAVVIDQMRNVGHMKKFVDPETERGATETELPLCQ